MPLEERLSADDLSLGLVILDPLLIMLQFWSGDLVLPGNRQELSIEQRMFLCDQSDRLLLCTGRKIAKTLSLERDIVQIGMTHDAIGTLDEALFFTPGEKHLEPVRDRIFSVITREPLFMEMIERNPHGNPIMSKGEGVIQFKTGLKWHMRIEGQSGTDANMVGLRCRYIVGDELAFGNDVCHRSRVNTALPGCRWKYCGVPNGVRGTPFWKLDQTPEGDGWSRHKYPQFINPLYSSESEKRKLAQDHGGVHSHSYITQVLGEWGDEVMSSFPPGTIATYSNKQSYTYDWGASAGRDSGSRTATLDSLAHSIPRVRCVVGWDYGVSPDPAAISLFFEEEPGEWYVRVLFILRQVPFPYQISFINQLRERFGVVMVCTDEASAIQQLAGDTSHWIMCTDGKNYGNVMWANVGGKIDLTDEAGQVVMDQFGNPLREYRKKWATDELRNGMVHAKENLPYPYHIYLPENPALLNELSGTTEKRTTHGYVQYLTAEKTPGSKSPDDHRTDSLRYGVLGIATLVQMAQKHGPAELSGVMGWVKRGIGDWTAPWSADRRP